MELHIHHHGDPRLDMIVGMLERITARQEKMMATLDQILADVTAQQTALDSVIALIQGLRQQLADALSGVTLPPAVQAKVDAIFEAAEFNGVKIAQALAENVPPEGG